MRVSIDKNFGRAQEMKKYYESSLAAGMSLNQVLHEIQMWLASFDRPQGLICGRGANHVWLSEKETGERLLLITRD